MSTSPTPPAGDDQVQRVHDRYASAARHLATGHTEPDREPGQNACFGASHYTGETLDDLPVGTSLGCVNPVAVSELRPGETVLDLGAGASLDILLSARRVGPAGRAIGLDMTGEMLDLARRHAADAGVINVEFRRGRIEDIPLPNASVDVVISNCVITLSADKPRVFAEIVRVLRPGGRIGISDVLAEHTLTDAERAARADQIECLASSLTTDQYAALLATAGLTDLEIQTTHPAGDKLHAAIIRATKPLQRNNVPAHIVPMTDAHADAVLAIYQAGLNTGNASFETTTPTWDYWDRAHLTRHRFVALDDQHRVVGWIAAARCPVGASTPGCSNTASTSTPTTVVGGSVARCWPPTSPPPKLPVSGCCKRGSSPRIWPVSPCTIAPDSALSGAANASANTTATGATSSSSNAAAPRPASRPTPPQLRIRVDLPQQPLGAPSYAAGSPDIG